MSASLSPVRLIVGEEELLRARAVADIVAGVRRADPDCDIRESPAAQLTLGDVYDLLSPSLFAQQRVLVIADAQEAGQELARAVLAYAADPAPDITVVVVHPGGARNKAFLDGLRRAGAAVVDCPKVTRQEERTAFVRAEVRAQGGSIDPAAVGVLLDAVGTDLRELAMACAQLVGDTAGTIDAAAVHRYHRGRAEVTGFMVADRAVVGDGPGALEALRWALSVGVAHVLVADALADGIRSIARVSSAGRANPYDLARSLGMPPWKVKRAQQQSRGWSERGLHQAMQVVADVNAEVKGSAADPGYALERAVLQVATARSRT